MMKVMIGIRIWKHTEVMLKRKQWHQTKRISRMSLPLLITHNFTSDPTTVTCVRIRASAEWHRNSIMMVAFNEYDDTENICVTQVLLKTTKKINLIFTVESQINCVVFIFLVIMDLPACEAKFIKIHLQQNIANHLRS